MSSGTRRIYLTSDKLPTYNLWVVPQFFSKEIVLPSAVAARLEAFKYNVAAVDEYLEALYLNPNSVDTLTVPEVLREVEQKQPQLGNSKKKTSTK